MKTTYVCPTCHKIFIDNQPRKYCSYRCSRLNKTSWNKGLTKETSAIVARYGAAVSKARKGVPLKPEHRAKIMMNLRSTWEKNASNEGRIRQTHNDGYFQIKTLDGWKYLHRYVVEQELGVTLTTKDHIHHKDGDPSNNHISNLKITAMVPHLSEHRKHIPKKSKFVPCYKCGKLTYLPPFRIKVALHNFCSKQCAKQRDYGRKGKPQKRINLVCPKCGKDFTKTPSQFADTSTHYCSAECWYSRNR